MIGQHYSILISDWLTVTSIPTLPPLLTSCCLNSTCLMVQTPPCLPSVRRTAPAVLRVMRSLMRSLMMMYLSSMWTCPVCVSQAVSCFHQRIILPRYESQWRRGATLLSNILIMVYSSSPVSRREPRLEKLLWRRRERSMSETTSTCQFLINPFPWVTPPPAPALTWYSGDPGQ